MKAPVLDDRLMSVAARVGQDAVLADIGTDHAFLPVFLLATGKIRRAVCTDIHEGPLATAKKNAAASGVSDLCDFLLTDGLTGVENYPVTDVAIAGMGGEMIADILGRADPELLRRVRLILQPMTKQEHLRRALGALGIRTESETYSRDGQKYYLTLTARYDGTVRSVSPEEAFFGEAPDTHLADAAYLGYLSAKRRALQTAKAGKSSAGLPTDGEERLLCALFDLLSRKENNT